MKPPQSKSTKLDEGLLELHDKHFAGGVNMYIINEMADDIVKYHDVMDNFLLDVQAYIESKVLEGQIKTLKSVATGRIDIPLGLEVLRQRLAELTPKGRSEK